MKHIVSRMSSYFPNRWPLSYLNLTKNMKTYIRRQQHKKCYTPRHKTKRTTTEVSLWQASVASFCTILYELSVVCNIFVTEKYIYYEIVLILHTKCTELTFDLTVTLKRKFMLGIRPYIVGILLAWMPSINKKCHHELS